MLINIDGVDQLVESQTNKTWNPLTWGQMEDLYSQGTDYDNADNSTNANIFSFTCKIICPMIILFLTFESGIDAFFHQRRDHTSLSPQEDYRIRC